MIELGPDLSAQLDSEGSPDRAVAEIANSPALLAECRTALPALKAVAEAKAGQDGVRRVIAKRFETYPQPQRTDEQWAAWWADYFDVLSDVGLASLEAGMRAYVAMPDSEFMPKPGRLRELAFSAPCRALTRYYRARMAIQKSEERPVEIPQRSPEKIAEEERLAAENRAQIAKLAAEFKAKTMPTTLTRPPLPSIAGKPDETGITPQMRELLNRQAGR